MLNKFGDEIIIHSQQHHPNIVKLLGVHYPSGSQLPMLVMEYLPYTLTKLLESKHVLDRYSVLLDVATGLEYLHSKQPPIIHRDLSANNILLTSYYMAKIADLGVSIFVKSQKSLQLTTAPGNHHIMPPEALVHDPVYNEKLDIFSFGCLILHTLTGQLPVPTDQFTPKPNNRESYVKVSEWERRVKFVEMLSKDNLIGLVPLAKQCLSNDPLERPDMIEVVEKVKGQFLL